MTLPGLTLVISGIALAMTLFSDTTQDAKKKVDALKAASADAKAAFDEKRGSVESLGKKIDELLYKQTSLEGNEKALAQTNRELQAQFGNLGYQMGVNNNIFSVMIGKLKSLKKEMQEMADLKLSLQIKEDKTLLKAQITQLNTSLGKAGKKSQRGTDSVDRLGLFVKGEKVLESGLTPQQQKSVTDGLAVFKEAANKPGFAESAEGSAAIIRAAKTLDIIQDQLTTPKQKEAFKSLAEPLSGAVGKAMEVSRQRMLVDAGLAEQTSRGAKAEFEAKPVFGGKTFEEALPSNYDVQTRLKGKNPKLKPTELYRATRQEINDKLDKIEVIEGTLIDLAAGAGPQAEAAKDALRDAKNRKEELRSQGKKYHDTIKGTLKNEMVDAVNKLKIQSRDAKFSKAKQAEFFRQAGEKEAEFAMLGTFGFDEQAEATANRKRELGEARAQQKEHSGGDRKAEQDRNYREQEKEAAASLRNEAAVFEARAKGNKVSATNAQTIEEVDSYLSKAIDNLLLAKVKKVEAVTHEQNARVGKGARDKKTLDFMATEVEAEREKGAEAIETFVNGATSIYKSVRKQTNRFGAKAEAEAKEAQLKQLKSDAEEALFEAAGPLTETKIQIAAGNIPAGTPQEKQQELALTKVRLEGLGKELSFFAGYIQVLTEATEEAKAQVEVTKAELKKAISPEEKARIRAKLEVDLENQKSTSDRLRTAKKDQTQVRGQVREAEIKATAETEAIPVEDTWENIEKRIKKVINSQKIAVQNFGDVEIIGNGIQGVLGGLSSGFANMFSNILSGSMSAASAFKQFAAGIVQAMLGIIAQMLALQAMKALFSVFGLPGFSVGGVVGKVNGSAGTGAGSVTAAEGGELFGGIPGRDSIPVMAMPGEFIVKKSAVDAVGVDFMHGLNTTTSKNVSANSSAVPRGEKTGEVTNIWVVTPDQKPTMGPRDVLLVVADSLNQGQSSIKTLVKSIAMGQA